MATRRTPLYPTHIELGARMTTFAGWEMPVAYPAGTIAEHRATRASVGIFDISHMARFIVTGAAGVASLDAAVSARVARIAVGSSSYALLCRDDGGVIDDLFIYRTAADTCLIVANASRAEADRQWLEDHDVPLTDVSSATAMIAVQGPRAAALVDAWAGRTGGSVGDVARFGVRPLGAADGSEGWAARTGYTGEDGFELIVPAGRATAVWSDLLSLAQERGIAAQPAGLGARDTLRLEAGFALYGHELSEAVTPIEARLAWACDLDGSWVGVEAIRRRKADGAARTLRRLVIEGAGVPREGYEVVDEAGEAVGTIASGGRGPTVDAFIANAFVDERVPGNAPLAVRIRDRVVAARQHRGPIYRATYRTLPVAGDLLDRAGEYRRRHNGSDEREVAEMVAAIGADSLDELIDQTVPRAIRRAAPLRLPPALTEAELARRTDELASRNTVLRSLIGMGYADTETPAVIRRTILENPLWYTQYTPYQAEISQGRLEALVNFQTMVVELTAMEVANASMLDEASSVAEAMAMAARHVRSQSPRVLVDAGVHPQTIEHVKTRAAPLGIAVHVAPAADWSPQGGDIAGIVQYPDTDGVIVAHGETAAALHAVGALAIVAADILALTLLSPPGEWGADIVCGNTQRFGVPLGYGGPHAAFLATRERFKRLMPGRVVGVSTDSRGRPALRLALQTREQHIRRDKATSNICTAQVLLAIMASMYAVYHGPAGLRRIARRVQLLTVTLRDALAKAGFRDVAGGAPGHAGAPFDTVTIAFAGEPERDAALARARAAGFNLRSRGAHRIGITLDERSTLDEVATVVRAVTGDPAPLELGAVAAAADVRMAPEIERSSPFLTQRVFNAHHSETKLLRYITTLQSRDLSLAHAMIPLGSCTMKLNAAATLQALSDPRFGAIHPYAPSDQAAGYHALAAELSAWLSEVTDLPACSLQPNSGATGEYTGLLMIRSYHHARGDDGRDVCLVPDSAHGTNPASAVMAGMRVVVVRSAANGDIDLDDLRARVADHAERIAALMITYPSTHGVFETGVQEAIAIVHAAGGQVYMDGANMNAQVGLTSPGAIGADVCHLNLHKTFAIPHGGGGPGVGPVLAAAHLAPYLPGTLDTPGPTGIITAAPLGSALALTISYAYIAMMGGDGLTEATRRAILNANYIAHRVGDRIPIVYTGAHGRVAHECILDLRAIEKETGVTVEDVAKRLADFGFHAPTMSWPVHGTLMVEPTESEGREELDRFCDALIAIADEIDEIRSGMIAVEESPLRHAPHTTADLADTWDRAYSRERGAFPAPWMVGRVWWPAVNRVDNVAGDRTLMCTCAPLEAYAGAIAQ